MLHVKIILLNKNQPEARFQDEPPVFYAFLTTPEITYTIARVQLVYSQNSQFKEMLSIIIKEIILQIPFYFNTFSPIWR